MNQSQAEEGTLREFIQQKRRDFQAKLGRSFTTRKRVNDFRLLFLTACRRRYPQLHLQWLHKHHALTTLLLQTYTPEQLLPMIDVYLSSDKYRLGRGITFDGFYYACPTIATDLAEKQRTENVVSNRKKYLADADAKRDAEEQAFLEAFNQGGYVRIEGQKD